MQTIKKNNNWYIIRSMSNKEKSVSEKLLKESNGGELLGKVTQVLVPTENSYYMKNGKKVKREKVMFPGYVFIETPSPSEVKEYLKHVKGASGFLTSRSGEIQALSQSEVNRMLGIQEESNKKDMINPFIVTEEVQITDGPFSTFKAIIEEIDGDKVKLSVSIFGRKTPLELSVYQITKV
jgi:transcriptional antiterminator NusG